MLVFMYLAAIVAANLIVAVYGPAVSIVTAFLFIGLDLTARDSLHEKWDNKNLFLKMALLIAAGSILSAVVNLSAAPVAIASFAAFAAAGTVDALIYQLLRNRRRLIRMNGSNLFSAAVDSVVFPALAFGFPLLIPIMAGQFVAKVGGGFLWSIILSRLLPPVVKPVYN